MIRAIVIAAALALSGCASYLEMQASEPRLTITSDKSVDEFVGCAMPRARELFRSYASVGPDGDAQVIVISSESANFASTTVAPREGGSTITYRSSSTLGYYGDWPDELRACQ